MTDAHDKATLQLLHPDPHRLTVQFAGDWTLSGGTPPTADVWPALRRDAVSAIDFAVSELGRWDSTLVACIVRIVQVGQQRNADVDLAALPPGVRRLVELACAVPAPDAGGATPRPGWIGAIGDAVQAVARDAGERLGFLGDLMVAGMRLLRGRSHFRARDLWWCVQECGIQALPIVALISFLVGTILAFIGAVQLQQFGAQVYVADLVGLAMAREMAPMMTAIIMAGRTGAAFAARLGTMVVNDEVDALRTLGFDPMEFLVLPRVVALATMMPLLCAYSNAIGIAGGMVVGVSMLDLTTEQYWTSTCAAVGVADFGIGLVKSAIFGALIALAGCLDGLRCGRSAAAVGSATTLAVVHAIVAIIVTDAICAVLTNVFRL